MKTVISVKVDENVKKQAQAVAGSVGLRLSTLINAYLTELAQTGQVHFTSVEMMTPELEDKLAIAEEEVQKGETIGPFSTAKEAIESLRSQE